MESKKQLNMDFLVAGEGFEPSKAEPGDLQSPPIGRSGNPPGDESGPRLPPLPVLKTPSKNPYSLLLTHPYRLPLNN